MAASSHGNGADRSPPTLRIVVDDLTHPALHALLAEHLADMHAHSPPESVHALDLERLRAPGISFWSAWDGDTLLGCARCAAEVPGARCSTTCWPRPAPAATRG